MYNVISLGVYNGTALVDGATDSNSAKRKIAQFIEAETLDRNRKSNLTDEAKWARGQQVSNFRSLTLTEPLQANFEVPYLDEAKTATLPMAGGLIAVVGASKSGKTTYLMKYLKPRLQEKYNVHTVNFVEPNPSDYDMWLQDPLDLVDYIAHVANKSLSHESEKTVILLDSLRFFMYAASTGGTGSGGLNMPLTAQLTALHNVCEAAGVLVIANLNPQVKAGSEKWDDVIESLTGSMPMLLVSKTAGTRKVKFFANDTLNGRPEFDSIIPSDLDKVEVSSSTSTFGANHIDHPGWDPEQDKPAIVANVPTKAGQVASELGLRARFSAAREADNVPPSKGGIRNLLSASRTGTDKTDKK